MRNAIRSSVAALAVVLGLAACTSNPSARAVAEDMIESLPDLSDAQRTCLLEKLDGYDNAQLDAIAAGNEDIDYGAPNALESTTEPFQEFVRDLETCTESD